PRAPVPCGRDAVARDHEEVRATRESLARRRRRSITPRGHRLHAIGRIPWRVTTLPPSGVLKEMPCPADLAAGRKGVGASQMIGTPRMEALLWMGVAVAGMAVFLLFGPRTFPASGIDLRVTRDEAEQIAAGYLHAR